MTMSNDIPWPQITQARLYHSVAEAIKTLTQVPRPVEVMPLTGWREDANGRGRFVTAPGFVPAYYRFDNIDMVPDDIVPVILAEVNEKPFVLDGAHRLAKWILLNRPSIPVLRLTAAESKACVRPGMEKTVAALIL